MILPRLLSHFAVFPFTPPCKLRESHSIMIARTDLRGVDMIHHEHSKAADLSWIPPHAYFVVSAVFHYLGPAFAVLLFAHVGVLGVAWLRIASAAVVFAAWRRPWRQFRTVKPAQRRLLIAMGVVLGLMNASFYLAIARLPLGTVGAIGFLGQSILA